MRGITLACVAIAVLVHADTASCQEEDELIRWVPSLGFTVGFISQGAEGVQQSNLRPYGLPGEPIDGSANLVDAPVLFSAELMTPGIESLPGSPRGFAHGDVGAIFGSQVIVASEGSPGPFEIPASQTYPGAAVGGQGTQTTVENETLIAGGGLGIAFSGDLLGRRLRLKPSFEYLRYEVTVEGVLQNVSGDLTVDENTLMFTAFERQEQKTLHSIGCGLELEMDTLRAGPFLLSLFLNGQVYWLLGDDEIHLSATDGTNFATWDATLDGNIYRGSAGMRFRFLPGP